MASFVFVAGPPASARLWSGVQQRLESLGHTTQAIELFDGPPADPTVDGLARAVATHLDAIPGATLVAHGAAVPVALRAVALSAPAHLVLTNGALGGLDPITGAVCRAAQASTPFAMIALHPRLWTRWLSSSAGLRRAVVNPYVMDRDTVVALCAPYLQTMAHRRAATRFLAELPAAASDRPRPGCPTLLLWGDEDPLYPAHVADSALRWMPDAEVRVVPGGQHLHPIERPWAMADELHAWTPGERSPKAQTG